MTLGGCVGVHDDCALRMRPVIVERLNRRTDMFYSFNW